jgi:hypothetical protein
MMILFPASPLSHREPDPAFEAEVAAARDAGFSIGVAEMDGDLRVRLPPDSGDQALYRGWIVTSREYAQLESRLAARGISLVTTSGAYEHCHYLPAWYDAIGDGRTPRSIWFAGDTFDLETVADAVVAEFGERAVIVKDYVKSRKHEWFDACFIRSAADRGEFKRVVTNFLNRQGDALVGGLVFREFVDFKSIGAHSKSAMPLVHEFRMFVLDGKIVTKDRYWGEGNYEAQLPDGPMIAELIPLVQSRFFALDLAQKADGAWLVMELNDGGSAGVPDGSDVRAFYAGLALALGG